MKVVEGGDRNSVSYGGRFTGTVELEMLHATPDRRRARHRARPLPRRRGHVLAPPPGRSAALRGRRGRAGGHRGRRRGRRSARCARRVPAERAALARSGAGCATRRCSPSRGDTTAWETGRAGVTQLRRRRSSGSVPPAQSSPTCAGGRPAHRRLRTLHRAISAAPGLPPRRRDRAGASRCSASERSWPICSPCPRGWSSSTERVGGCSRSRTSSGRRCSAGTRTTSSSSRRSMRCCARASTGSSTSTSASVSAAPSLDVLLDGRVRWSPATVRRAMCGEALGIALRRPRLRPELAGRRRAASTRQWPAAAGDHPAGVRPGTAGHVRAVAPSPSPMGVPAARR